MDGVRQYDVLGLGALAVDDLLYVDGYPPAEAKVRVRRRLRQCGGLTGTALVAAARLGARCAYAGALGDDPLSQYVLDGLSAEGVDMGPRFIDAAASPAHSTIIVDETAGTRTVFASAEGRLGPAPHWPEASLIRAAGVLLVDHHGPEGTLRAVRIAREAGVAVVGDFERDPGPPLDEILALTDHLVLGWSFATRQTGETSPEETVRALWREDRQAVVVTCGAMGCWFLAADAPHTVRHQEAFAVTAADTTGCGDVFHGAYAWALAAGLSPAARVRAAAAAAALKAGVRGGQAGCPTRAALEEFLRS